MILISISMLAIFFWLGGYFMTAHKMSNTGLLSDDLEKIISPPKWLYYLCGAPVSDKYPRGTMRVAAFGVQVGGIALGIYAIWFSIWKPSILDSMIGLTFSTIFTYTTTIYISKHYATRGQKKR